MGEADVCAALDTAVRILHDPVATEEHKKTVMYAVDLAVKRGGRVWEQAVAGSAEYLFVRPALAGSEVLLAKTLKLLNTWVEARVAVQVAQHTIYRILDCMAVRAQRALAEPSLDRAMQVFSEVLIERGVLMGAVGAPHGGSLESTPAVQAVRALLGRARDAAAYRLVTCAFEEHGGCDVGTLEKALAHFGYGLRRVQSYEGWPGVAELCCDLLYFHKHRIAEPLARLSLITSDVSATAAGPLRLGALIDLHFTPPSGSATVDLGRDEQAGRRSWWTGWDMYGSPHEEESSVVVERGGGDVGEERDAMVPRLLADPGWTRCAFCAESFRKEFADGQWWLRDAVARDGQAFHGECLDFSLS